MSVCSFRTDPSPFAFLKWVNQVIRVEFRPSGHEQETGTTHITRVILEFAPNPYGTAGLAVADYG